MCWDCDLPSLLELSRKLWAGWKLVAASKIHLFPFIYYSMPNPFLLLLMSTHRFSDGCGCANNSTTASTTVKDQENVCLGIFAGFHLAASTAMNPIMFGWPLWQSYWIFNYNDKIMSRHRFFTVVKKLTLRWQIHTTPPCPQTAWFRKFNTWLMCQKCRTYLIKVGV